MSDRNIRLPTVADFRRYGPLHQAPAFDIYNNLPGDVLVFIFPNYFLLEENVISEDYLVKLRLFCFYLRKQAEYEDFIQEMNDQKELQLRRLEEKLNEKYKKMSKTCSVCQINELEF